MSAPKLTAVPTQEPVPTFGGSGEPCPTCFGNGTVVAVDIRHGIRIESQVVCWNCTGSGVDLNPPLGDATR